MRRWRPRPLVGFENALVRERSPSLVQRAGALDFPEHRQSRAPPSKSDSSIPPGAVGQSAKVEANGSVDLTIGDGTLQSVLGKLTILASAEGGFVASTQAQLGPAEAGSSSSGVIVLRVPEANFGALVTQVQRDGTHIGYHYLQDVTGQYVNLQARIAALESSRQQYLTIMTRASSIGDILAVQSQLDTLQSEIDQLQGQLNVLDNETTYGSLTVSLSERGKPRLLAPRPRPPASGSEGLGQECRRLRVGDRVDRPNRGTAAACPDLSGRTVVLGEILAGGRAPSDALKARSSGANGSQPDAGAADSAASKISRRLPGTYTG